MRNYSKIGQSHQGSLLDVLYANHFQALKKLKPRNRHALEKRLSGKMKRGKARLFFIGRRRRWSRRYQTLIRQGNTPLLLKTRAQKRRLSRRYSLVKVTRSDYGVRRQPLLTMKYLPHYNLGVHFSAGVGGTATPDLPSPILMTSSSRGFGLSSQPSRYAHLTQNVFFLKKIVTNSSLYKYTLLKLPQQSTPITPKAYSVDTLDRLYFGSRAEQLKTSNV